MSLINTLQVLQDVDVGENLQAGTISSSNKSVTSINTTHINIKNNNLYLNNGNTVDKDFGVVGNIKVDIRTIVAMYIIIYKHC
jgi:hypothetical protein